MQADKLAQLNIPVADIEQIQANIDLFSKLANRIAFAMAKVYEQFCIATAIAGGHTHLHSGGAVGLNKANIHQYIEEMRVTLSDHNFMDDAALFVTPSVASLIRQSSLFDGFREGLDVRQNGWVGRMSGFQIFESNLIPSTKMLAMGRNCLHFVEQMGKTDFRDAPNGFRTQVISELVYGGKVFTELSKGICDLLYS
jgi:hypothetical protein